MSRQRLEEDLEMVKGKLIFLKENQDKNFEVMESCYLQVVSNIENVLPMNHRLGRNVYYQQLKAVLEKAKNQGNIPLSELPDRAPDYLRAIAV